jgi:hypothetical protein
MSEDTDGTHTRIGYATLAIQIPGSGKVHVFCEVLMTNPGKPYYWVSNKNHQSESFDLIFVEVAHLCFVDMMS